MSENKLTREIQKKIDSWTTYEGWICEKCKLVVPRPYYEGVYSVKCKPCDTFTLMPMPLYKVFEERRKMDELIKKVEALKKTQPKLMKELDAVYPSVYEILKLLRGEG